MALTASCDLHLEDFIAEVQALRKPNTRSAAREGSRDFELRAFWDLVRRLKLTDECLNEHIYFRDDTYARNLVVLTPRFEMLVLCWHPGQNSRVHDHKDSFSVVKVLRGTLSNHIYERLDDGSRPDYCDLRKVRTDLVGAGEYSPLDVGGIHMIENAKDSGEDLVTLHFYAEPLRDVQIFHPDQHKVETAHMRYSLEDRT